MTGKGPGSFASQATGLLNEIEHEAGSAVAAIARNVLRQLDSPLRVAVVGRAKSGKSTFVNALVGRAIAPTGSTDTTSVPVWYRFGETVGATAVLVDDERYEVDYSCSHQSASFTFGEGDNSAIRRVEVTQPIDFLRTVTVIDAPGISGQLDSGSSRTSYDGPLLNQDPADTPDVVIYMMRYAQEQDIDYLQANGIVRPSETDPLRAVGILSRADELGGGRADAMDLATVLARRLEPSLSPLLSSLHPVSGLLAAASNQTGETELQHLTRLAAVPLEQLDTILRSADAFVRSEVQVPVQADDRRRLVDRYGMFGVRRVVSLLTSGAINPVEVADHLGEVAGIAPIREVVLDQFGARSEVLRTSTSLAIASRLIPEVDNPDVRARLVESLDRIRAESPDLRELDHLRLLRLSTDLHLDKDERAMVERCLGRFGTASYLRVGAAESDTSDSLRTKALEIKRSLSAMRGARGPARNAVQAAMRSLDRVLADIDTATT